MLQDSLKRRKVIRALVLELPGFLGLAAIVSSTTSSLWCRGESGKRLQRKPSIRVFVCPIDVPAFTVKQYWHLTTSSGRRPSLVTCHVQYFVWFAASGGALNEKLASGRREVIESTTPR